MLSRTLRTIGVSVAVLMGGCQTLPRQSLPPAVQPISGDELTSASCVKIAKDSAALESLRKTAVDLLDEHGGDKAGFERNTPSTDALAQCKYFQKVVEFYRE